jgi:hypothetical protein
VGGLEVVRRGGARLAGGGGLALPEEEEHLGGLGPHVVAMVPS